MGRYKILKERDHAEGTHVIEGVNKDSINMTQYEQELSNSVSVVSFTHLGYKKDLKSFPTYYSVKSLYEENMVDKIYVLDVADSYDIDRSTLSIPIPGGKFIPRILYAIGSIVPQINARNIIIRLLDAAASKKVGEEKVLHTFPQFINSIENSKKHNATSAVYASFSHPNHTRSLLASEHQKYYNRNNLNKTKMAVRHGFDKADYILYLSEYSKDTFIENGFEENRLLKVGPLGTDIDHYTPTTPPEDEFVAVSVANMAELKGIRYLIDAWEKLSIPNARLILCGTMNKAVETALKPRIERMESVDHVGYVDDPHEYYKKASVLVHPSLTEGFSKTISEAMASELPVIITEHCQREFIDNAGFVVPIRDSDAIADRLQYIYEHPEEAKEMGQRGRKITEQNTWDDFSTRVMEAHKEILRREDHV